MDGPRSQGWAPLASLRSHAAPITSSLYVSFSRALGLDGWSTARRFPFGSFYVCFLGPVGWVGRDWLPFSSLHSYGWVAVEGPLGSVHISFLRPGSDGWAAATGLGFFRLSSYFLSGLLNPLHTSFLGGWVVATSWALIGLLLREPSFLAADHPSDPGAQKGNMKGAQMEVQLLCRGQPIRPRTQKEGNMKGAQREQLGSHWAPFM